MESMPSEQDEIDDAALIRKVLSGARDDFRHLLLRHQDQVFAVILRQVGERQLAKELAQETFVKAYKNLSQFRFKSTFSTWLVRIALNTTNSYFASAAYKKSMKTQSLDKHTAEVLAADASDQNFTEEALNKLRNAIASLNAKHREAIVLCGLNGYSYEAAADVLSIPVGTVRSRLNKARLQLKQMLMTGE